MMNSKIYRLFLSTFFLAGVFVFQAHAGQEFRGFDSIASPYESAQQIDVTKEGYQVVPAVKNVPQGVVDQVVRELFNTWNTPGLSRKLSKDLPNKTRILDSINSSVPRHMELQVLSVQNARTVEQYLRPHPSGDGSYQLLSKVAVTVRSQIGDSYGVTREFKRVEGASEYLISIVQKVKTV